MTHSPPIPAGNQSPYPIQEPPHQHAPVLPPVERHEDVPALSTGTVIGAAVVAGIGAAAAAAAYFLSVRKAPKAKPRSKRKPRAAKAD